MEHRSATWLGSAEFRIRLGPDRHLAAPRRISRISGSAARRRIARSLTIEEGEKMRRTTIAIAALTVVIGLGSMTPTAVASGIPRAGALHKPWIRWAFGSSSAPLLDQDLCGEM